VGQGQKTLSQDNGSLSSTDNTSSNHDEVVIDNTVVGESSKRGDILFVDISLSGGVVLDSVDGTSTHSVDLLVDFSSVVITVLTSSGTSPSYGSWMPSSNTTDLS